ncbi:MAG: rhamnulose-1-phosphate aldolase, partial [Firmicutes bacterium]|nr:rhamnulose-1-phosphate aldolase [Bacillota bacterium]
MKDISTAPFLIKMVQTITEMYRQGWDERNGGNISLLLDEAEVAEYLDLTKVLRAIPTGFEAPELEGRYFLVTCTGSYFRNVQYDPETDLGILRLADGGRTAELLWGYKGGGQFTSEFAAHILSHAARLSVDPESRVILHCHPAGLIAMTYVHDLD